MNIWWGRPKWKHSKDRCFNSKWLKRTRSFWDNSIFKRNSFRSPRFYNDHSSLWRGRDSNSNSTWFS